MQHRSRGIVCPEFQTHYTFYCVADVYLVACAPNRTQWQQQGAVCSGGPPPQRTNLRLAIGRITSPGPLLTPPPSFSPPKTPHRSYSAITPPRYVNPTPPSPGGRGSSRQGLRGLALTAWVQKPLRVLNVYRFAQLCCDAQHGFMVPFFCTACSPCPRVYFCS